MPYANPEKRKEYDKKYREEHREQRHTWAKGWYQRHLERERERRRQYEKTYHKRPDVIEYRRKWKKENALKLKIEALTHYGGEHPKCVCPPCGETLLELLTLDHINNDGAKQKKDALGRNISGSAVFYAWLKKNNWPKGLQVMCFSCNIGKGLYGVCPHEKPQILTLQ
jgi:hypothetical protein